MAESVVFTNAYATEPVCCPARTAFLSGGFYPHHTNVLANKAPIGGATQFSDSVSLGTELQQKGYATALIGKYLNDYKKLFTPPTGYVPPGWTLFQATIEAYDWYTTKDVRGSSRPNSSDEGTIILTQDKYQTYHYRDTALEFLDSVNGRNFFLMLSVKAPHLPAIPPAGYETLYSDYSYTGRGWNEVDLSDKPGYVRSRQDQMLEGDIRNMLRSLKGVDQAIAAIVGSLQQDGRWDDTIFIFTSDHGYLWGEHGLTAKTVPYEEALRTPLVIRYPGVAPRTEARLVTSDLDLGATILDTAGVTDVATEGTSLVPLLLDPTITWRDHLFHENFDLEGWKIPSWVTLNWQDEQGGHWKYTEYATGEAELYDLVADPFELENVAGSPVYSTTESIMAMQLATWNRGLAIMSENLPRPGRFVLPEATVGQPYAHTFVAWGGLGDYVWSIDTEGPGCAPDLPAALTLGTNGLLAGTPNDSGIWRLCIVVNDSSISPQPGNTRPQEHQMQFKLRIKP